MGNVTVPIMRHITVDGTEMKFSNKLSVDSILWDTKVDRVMGCNSTLLALTHIKYEGKSLLSIIMDFFFVISRNQHNLAIEDSRCSNSALPLNKIYIK